MLLVQDQYLFEFEGVADCAYLTLSDILNIRKHALMKRFAFSRLGSVRVKLTFDQARCDQASLRVQLPSEFKSEMPRSELSQLPTRPHGRVQPSFPNKACRTPGRVRGSNMFASI